MDDNSPIGQNRVPTRASSFIHRLKVIAHQAIRLFQDWRNPPLRFFRGELAAEPVKKVSHRSPLWTSDVPEELALQLGKVQNLRVAIQELNGILIHAGQEFSFWKQIGRTTARRGYVRGRELREGCLIPAMGGGICQLSNVLYDLALTAGFEIVEQHSHSQIIPGSAAETGRDATVAWNYIDLRFRSEFDFQMSAELTRDELVVSYSILGEAEPVKQKASGLIVLNTAPGACETCGESECFLQNRHHRSTGPSHGSACFVLDSVWPEFNTLLRLQAERGDSVLYPIQMKGFERYAWEVPEGVMPSTAPAAAIRRSVRARRQHTPPQLRAGQIRDADELVRALSPKIPFETTHLVTDISLLKELHRSGALGGRSVEVWVTRFPLKLIHELLDSAAEIYPSESQLSDFRASKQDAEEEWEALMLAEKLVTPHIYLAEKLQMLLPGGAVLIDWVTPPKFSGETREDGYIFFPGPTAVREGALAVREAAIRRSLPVSVGGRNLISPDFWDGVLTYTPETHPMKNASWVVSPTVMKNRPDALLRGAAMDKQIISTVESGLALKNPILFGDVDALCDRLR